MPKILMIDDDTDYAASVRILFGPADTQISWARNGKEGLARIKELHPDAIILDLMMDSFTEKFHVPSRSVTLHPAPEVRHFPRVSPSPDAHVHPRLHVAPVRARRGLSSRGRLPRQISHPGGTARQGHRTPRKKSEEGMV